MSYQERSILVSMLIFFLIFRYCTCIDTITLTQPLKDGDILVSNGETFALGFFSPGNSSNRYVGIWYNKVSDQTIVWVANRDSPITNSSGILSVDETWNLVLLEKDQSFLFWSTNVSGVTNDAFSAQLLDSGNLVLFQGSNKGVYSWQSFDHPSNTLVSGMKFGLDKKTGLNRVFTSWKSSVNPGVGDYSQKMEFVGSTQSFFASAFLDTNRSHHRAGTLETVPKGVSERLGLRCARLEIVELAHVKVPDTSTARVNMSLGLKACEELCLRNCMCLGYASADLSKGDEGGGCITWHGDMIDTRTDVGS
ncbi:hypothetical protein L1987_86629 [Smallanthus sonchifolius]|uniref:Uncharacterized protein n=1 Tax=Smallanthus sonchifolius TaxID=185202 RepID=A0ACB8Y007_9ASTR|nr:hypothetical protein L1987_86629 [Smallanthus sonchifolius]